MINTRVFSPINEIIKDARKGKMFILVDDKDRENEGDLIIPGSKCNSKSINFMAKHGRGLICLALSKTQIDKLKLPLMSPKNKSRMQTAFTISIEAKKGISTGLMLTAGLEVLSTYHSLIPKDDGNLKINLFFFLGSYGMGIFINKSAMLNFFCFVFLFLNKYTGFQKSTKLTLYFIFLIIYYMQHKSYYIL